MNMQDIDKVGRALKHLDSDQALPICQVLADCDDARRFGITAEGILLTYVSPLGNKARLAISVAERSRALRRALIVEEGVHVHPERLTPAERRNLVSVLQQRAKASGHVLRTATFQGRFYYGIYAPGSEPAPVRGQSASTSQPGWTEDAVQE